MKNKAHFVKKLCQLRGLNHESPEAQELYKLSVVDLLIAIKKDTPVPEPETEPEDREDREDDRTLARLLGCS
jgi:hypothetical protein